MIWFGSTRQHSLSLSLSYEHLWIGCFSCVGKRAARDHYEPICSNWMRDEPNRYDKDYGAKLYNFRCIIRTFLVIIWLSFLFYSRFGVSMLVLVPTTTNPETRCLFTSKPPDRFDRKFIDSLWIASRNLREKIEAAA